MDFAPAFPLPPTTRIRYSHLRVADLNRMLTFYQHILGFEPLPSSNGAVTLSAGDTNHYLLALTATPFSVPASRRAPGLFHTAIRYPTRAALGQALQRILDAKYPMQGAADHGVSEALYMADPEGNGVELYTDRSQDEWPYSGGELAMVTEPLDLQSLLEAARPGYHGSREPDLGHIHLQVSDLLAAETFYAGVLGFTVMQRGYPGALFLAAGGYHHHIGLNTWNSKGAKPPAAGALGLQSFGIEIPDEENWLRMLDHLQSRRIAHQVSHSEGLYRRIMLQDPDGIGVEVVCRY